MLYIYLNQNTKTWTYTVLIALPLYISHKSSHDSFVVSTASKISFVVLRKIYCSPAMRLKGLCVLLWAESSNLEEIYRNFLALRIFIRLTLVIQYRTCLTKSKNSQMSIKNININSTLEPFNCHIMLHFCGKIFQ